MTFNLWGRRGKKKKDNVASVWSSCSPGNIIINCCQAKPLFQSYVMRTSPDSTSSQKWEILAYILLCLHSQIRATHWISFLCQVSFSLWCYFALFCPDSVFTRESRGHVCSAPSSRASPSYLSLRVWGEKEQMNVSKQQRVIPLFLSWRIQKKQTKKRCKNVVNVWLKVSLAGLHISDSFVYQRNTIALKKEERFAVLYIKWCLFSILTLQVTSEGATSTGFCTYM